MELKVVTSSREIVATIPFFAAMLNRGLSSRIMYGEKVTEVLDERIHCDIFDFRPKTSNCSILDRALDKRDLTR